MLSASVEITDIEPRQWRGWFELLVPARVRTDPRWALVLLEDGKPLSIAICGGDVPAAKQSAASEATFPGTSSAALARFTGELGVNAVVAIERAMLPTLQAEIDRSLDLSSDYVEQSLVILRALKKRSGQGIWSEPALLELLPAVSYQPLQRTFDLLIPDATSMVAYIFDSNPARLYASVIAVKRGGHIDRVATHLGISDAVAETTLAGNWRKRYADLLPVVSERYAPPTLAVFLERNTFYRIARGPSDQLAREMNASNVIIDPAPAWLLGLLGGATMAAIATRGAKALAGFLPQSARRMASDLANTAQAAMRDSGAHPFALLGFDPIELWHQIRLFYR